MRQLIDCIIEGLSRYGCGMMGIAYPDDENPTLGHVSRHGYRRPDE